MPKRGGREHTHLEVRLEALMLKKVAADSDATAFASIVFPFPGGPYRSKPAFSNPKVERHGLKSIIPLDHL